MVKGIGGEQLIILPRHKPVSGRKLHGVKVDDRLVESVQVRRLQFLCSGGTHSLRTYCCSVPQLFTFLPPLLPPATYPPLLLSPEPQHN